MATLAHRRVNHKERWFARNRTTQGRSRIGVQPIADACQPDFGRINVAAPNLP